MTSDYGGSLLTQEREHMVLIVAVSRQAVLYVPHSTDCGVHSTDCGGNRFWGLAKQFTPAPGAVLEEG